MIKVITGPVKSGKSKHLIQTYNDLCVFGDSCKIFSSKFSINSGNKVESRFGVSVKATPINTLYDILPFVKIGDTVFIDEFQFLQMSKQELFDFINKYSIHYDFYIYGLDKDYRGIPFHLIANIMAFADNIEKLKGNCDICSSHSSTNYSLRLINGEASKIDIEEELIILDNTVDQNRKVEYNSVCPDCWYKEYFI